MVTAKGVGRVIGSVVLVQMVAGAIENFVLLDPVNQPAPRFLVSAAANASQVSLAVLTEIANGGLALAIAITAWPLFRRCSEAMALWLLALAVVGVTLSAVEGTTLLSIVSLSQAYGAAGSADGTLYQALGALVGAARKWAHYLNLIAGGSGLFVMYAVVYRFALVPRALAALGLGAVLLQLVAVTMPLFGHPIMFILLMPLGLTQLAFAAWLLVRGLKEPPAA